MGGFKISYYIGQMESNYDAGNVTVVNEIDIY